MNTARLIAGILVVAALAAGIWFVRGLQQDRGEGPPPAAGPGEAHAVPDVTRDDAVLDLDGPRVRVAVEGRPIRASRPVRWRVRFEDAHGGVLEPAAAVLKFNMDMDMGRHHYALFADPEPGWYAAEAAIPMCPSGRTRWYGILEATLDGGSPLRGRFLFDLAP